MKYNQTLLLPVLSAAVALFTANQATAATIYSAALTSKDSVVGDAQTGYTAGTGYEEGSTANIIGETGSNNTQTRVNRVAILGFTLPTFAPGETLESAQLTFNINQMIRDKPELGDLDTYLLDTSDPAGTGTDLFYQSSTIQTATVGGISMEQIGRTPYNASFTNPQPVTYTLTGDSLALLQGFYTGNSPSQTEAFMRFNQTGSIAIGSSVDRYRIDLASVEFSFTAVPEPSCSLLVLFGILGMVARRHRR